MAHKKTLFIFGAGFSRNYTKSTHNIPNLISSINSDFFRNVKTVLDNTNYVSSKKNISKLFRYICKSWKLTYKTDYSFLFNENLEDMEEVFSDLSIRGSLFESKVDFEQHNDMFEVMKELTAYVIGRSVYGPVDPLFKEIVQRFNKNDVIVVFNYDLLLEKSLECIGNFSDSGYVINPYKKYENKRWTNITKTSLIEVIKLHGSINWLKCIECDSILTIDESLYSTNVFNCEEIKKLTCPRCRQLSSLSRIIIPPIQSKNYDENPIRFLWRYASNKLRDVKNIVSLGYSLPTTDYSSRSLLRVIKQYQTKRELSKINLITMNKTSNAEREYRKLLPIKRKNAKRSKDITSCLELIDEMNI